MPNETRHHRSDQLLLQAMARGERAAAETFVDRCLPLVRRMAYRLTGWQADIQDVVQEVFLAIQQNATTYRGEAKLETWVTAIVIRCCRRIRNRQSSGVTTCLADSLAPLDTSFLDQQIVQENEEEVHLAMRRLPEEQNEMLVLRYQEDWSLDSLAAFYGLRKNTVEVRLNRARQKLGAILAEQSGSERKGRIHVE